MSLTTGQREQLIQWLCVEEITYEAALVRLEKSFGVRSSTGALSTFWKNVCGPRMEQWKKMENAFLDIRVSVRQGEKIVGQTDLTVALGSNAVSQSKPVSFETKVQPLTPRKKR